MNDLTGQFEKSFRFLLRTQNPKRFSKKDEKFGDIWSSLGAIDGFKARTFMPRWQTCWVWEGPAAFGKGMERSWKARNNKLISNEQSLRPVHV